MAVDYDFYIKGMRFIIPEYDINYLYSPSESTVPRLAETSDSTVKIAGKDGDVTLDTTYNPLEFKLVVYTDENLEPKEKELEILKITAFLNSIKKAKKKFAFVDEELMYSLKYSGQLTITRFPKSVRFEIPLKSNQSFATDLNKKVINGAGYKISRTIDNTGCIITIEGHCQHPKISLNDYQMEYDNVILEGNKIIINTENSTITHVTSLGVRTNAAIYYNHEYPRIRYGKNEVKVLSGVDDNSQVTTEWYDLKI